MEGHHALRDCHFDIACIEIIVICQTIVHIFANPLIRSSVAFRALSLVSPSFPRFVHLPSSLGIVIAEPGRNFVSDTVPPTSLLRSAGLSPLVVIPTTIGQAFASISGCAVSGRVHLSFLILVPLTIVSAIVWS